MNTLLKFVLISITCHMLGLATVVWWLGEETVRFIVYLLTWHSWTLFRITVYTSFFVGSQTLIYRYLVPVKNKVYQRTDYDKYTQLCKQLKLANDTLLEEVQTTRKLKNTLNEIRKILADDNSEQYTELTITQLKEKAEQLGIPCASSYRHKTKSALAFSVQAHEELSRIFEVINSV